MDTIVAMLKNLWINLNNVLKSAVHRPSSGASDIIFGLHRKQDNEHWWKFIFGRASWFLMIAVVLVLSFTPFEIGPYKARRILIVIGLYLFYTIFLEISSRRFETHYDSSLFQWVRIVANFIFITVLIFLFPNTHSYFWSFYLLPILQSVIYFDSRIALLTGLVSIVSYTLLVITYVFPKSNSPDWAQLTLNCLILSMLSLVFSWLYVSAKENKKGLFDLRLTKLNQIAEHIHSKLRVDEILQIALTDGLEVIDTNEGSIMLLDHDSNLLKIRAWIVNGEFRLDKLHRVLRNGEGIAGYVASTGKSYVCANTKCDSRFIPSQSARQVFSILCVPIIATDGTVLGVINADSHKTNYFGSYDLLFLEELAVRLAVAISKAHEFDKSQWMVETLYQLHKTTSEIESETGLSTLLDQVSEQTAKLLSADSGGVLLLDEMNEYLSFHGSYGLGKRVIEMTRDRTGQSIAGRVAASEKPMIVNDVPNSDLFDNPEAQDEGFLSILSTPIWSENRVIGTLDIHSKTDHFAFTSDNLIIMELMARYAGTAIRKAKLFAEESTRKVAHRITTQVLKAIDTMRTENDSSIQLPNRLDVLLETLDTELGSCIPAGALKTVLQNNQEVWLYTHLKRNLHEVSTPRWSRPSRQQLAAYSAYLRTPLLLKDRKEIEFFCTQHCLDYGQNLTTEFWFAVPIIVGGKTVGSMILEEQQYPEKLGQSCRDLVELIIEQLSGTIYTAWLDEQNTQMYRQLVALQTASEEIMLLAEQKEEWMWHATLTLATAHYGLRYERAMLYLVADGGSRLQGLLGIGHIDIETASADWKKDESDPKSNFKHYLHLLQKEGFAPTPLDSWVKNHWVDLSDQNNAFCQLIRSGKVVQLAVESVTQRLPVEFCERFGKCAYSLIPVKAGPKVLGLVILSNPFKGEPHPYEALIYYDTLTNQVALIYENLQFRRALESLIALNHQILVQVNTQNLKETLTQICSAAQTVTGLDLIAIYPLQNNSGSLEYDLGNAGSVGRRVQSRSTIKYDPKSFTATVLSSRSTKVLGNIHSHTILYAGSTLAQHQFIIDESIQALIAVPIIHDDQPIGILYLNQRYKKEFTQQEIALAESLAHLASVTIKNSREFQGLRTQKEARDIEMRLLGEMLQDTLLHRSSEDEFIATILNKVSKLLPEDYVVKLALENWSRPTEEGATNTFNEPIKVYREFYLDKTKVLQKQTVSLSDHLDDLNGKMSLLIPIQLSDRNLGNFTIVGTSFEQLHQESRFVLDHLSNAVALALDNLSREKYLTTVLKTARVMTEPVELEETLKVIASEIQQFVTNLSTLTIWHKDPTSEREIFILGHHFGVSNVLAARGDSSDKHGTVKMVMGLPEAIFESDVKASRKFSRKQFTDREGIVSAAAFPLRVKNETIGAMFFSYRTLHKFTEEERMLFPILADIVAACINDALRLRHTERAKLQVEKEKRKLAVEHQITEVTSVTYGLDLTLSQIVKELGNLYPDTVAYIMLYNEATHSLDFVPNVQPLIQSLNPNFINIESIHLDVSCFATHLASQTLSQGRKVTLKITEPSELEEHKPFNLDTKSVVGVTLVSTDHPQGNKKLLGILILESPFPDQFPVDDVEELRAIAKQTRIAIERMLRSADLRFKSSIVGATSWITPIVHDIKRVAGRIRKRVARLQTDVVQMENEPELKPKVQEALAEIDQHISSLVGTVEETSPGREDLKPILLEEELPKWVNATVSTRSVDVSVEYNFHCPAKYINAHPRALRRAIHDLVRNALESMGWEPGQRLTICTRPAHDPQRLEILIEDNGPGISPELHLKLFNEPISTKGEERGFGLLFVRAAIEEMGGKVRLHSSTPNVGSVFALTLLIDDKPPTADLFAEEADNDKQIM